MCFDGSFEDFLSSVARKSLYAELNDVAVTANERRRADFATLIDLEKSFKTRAGKFTIDDLLRFLMLP